MEVIIASKNKGKIKEIQNILSDLEINFLSLNDYPDLLDIEEDGRTFEENAIKKATTISNLTGKVTLADDSGLEVDALNGLPGVKSARFGGDNLTDADRNQKLLSLLKKVPVSKRSARFKCVIAISIPEGKTTIISGECEGIISLESKGDYGFGYDPIFIPDGYNKTFGELDSSVKDNISHRFKALLKAKEILDEEGGVMKGKREIMEKREIRSM